MPVPRKVAVARLYPALVVWTSSTKVVVATVPVGTLFITFMNPFDDLQCCSPVCKIPLLIQVIEALLSAQRASWSASSQSKDGFGTTLLLLCRRTCAKVAKVNCQRPSSCVQWKL